MIRKLTRGAIIALTAVMLLLPFNKVSAGIPVGTWRSHPAYNNATQAVNAFGYIFVLSEGALYFYDPVDEGLYTLDKTGGLGDTDIAYIAYCKSENAVLLVYSNGNIDILYSNETIYNFTDLKNNNTGTVTVNEVKVDGNIAYISTNIGLVIFDVKRREIKNTYRLDSPINTSVIINDSLFCGTDSGIYVGLMSSNLLDKSNWTLFKDMIVPTLFVFDGQFSGLSNNNTVLTIDKATAQTTNIRTKVDGLSFTDDKLVLIQDTVVTIYNTYTDFSTYTFSHHVNDIIIDGTEWWACQGYYGLSRYKSTDDIFVCTSFNIKPNSPRRNWFHSVSWPQKDKLLVVGGCQNYSGISYPGTVMIYQNERWSSLEEDITSKTNVKYANLTEAVQDPLDPDHIFVGSAGQGLYEFKSGKFVKLYTWNNSGLVSILNDNLYYKRNYVRISALQYDKDNNLWMLTTKPIQFLKFWNLMVTGLACIMMKWQVYLHTSNSDLTITEDYG